MSYSFKSGGVIVWDPALRVGRLFLGQAQTAAELLAVPSGLTNRIDGTCDIDPAAFAAFVAALQEWRLKSSHPVLIPLVHGVLTVSLALLAKIGRDLPAGSGEAWESLRAEAALLEKAF
ncbi:DUF6086 family protein [Actinoplanes sp. NPDC026619]|uniref:DUF6086 family protein n=1 Tax=Actinoplanes sp. NPDC026619 TaxID=3155798 RepID=UPI0033CA8C12